MKDGEEPWPGSWGGCAHSRCVGWGRGIGGESNQQHQQEAASTSPSGADITRSRGSMTLQRIHRTADLPPETLHRGLGAHMGTEKRRCTTTARGSPFLCTRKAGVQEGDPGAHGPTVAHGTPGAKLLNAPTVNVKQDKLLASLRSERWLKQHQAAWPPSQLRV